MTGRRMTLGLSEGLFVLSSLSFPEMCSWFAAQLMLSRLACGVGISFCEAMLFGGDLDMVAAVAGEWNPNPKGPRIFFLESFRCRWRCWKLRRLLTAGEPPGPIHGAPCRAVGRTACGVVM